MRIGAVWAVLAVLLIGSNAAAQSRPEVTVIERTIDASNVRWFMWRMGMAAESGEILALDLTFGPSERGYSTFFAYRFETLDVTYGASQVVFEQGVNGRGERSRVVGLYRIELLTPNGPTDDPGQMMALGLDATTVSPNGPPRLVPDSCPTIESCGG